jgi:hypothetical protein
MESKPNSTNGCQDNPFSVEEAAGTESNRRFDHASTLPRKASLANMDECRMYFIAGAGLIKIGISTNVQSRFRAIKNSSPVPVELVAVTRGSTFCEGQAHRKFAHLRRHGEWFEDRQEIRDFIARRLANPAFDPDSDYSWAAAVEAAR